MTVTPTDLYAFGNRSGPRRPQVNKDLFPDAAGRIGPETSPPRQGMSTFAQPLQTSLTGHYHRLSAGTPLPEELGVVADGVDVDQASPYPATHHTIYPAVQMPADRFVQLYLSLPWQYGGKK